MERGGGNWGGFAGRGWGEHRWGDEHGWGRRFWEGDQRWGGWNRGYWYGDHSWWPRWWHDSWAWSSVAPFYVDVPALGGYGYYWYYCQSADAYYPDVPFCPEGWQIVPADG